jgi:hypothetical protein
LNYWFIVHGRRTGLDGNGGTIPLLLAQGSWTVRQVEAVRFDTIDQAREWLAAMKLQTPKLFADADARPERFESVSTERGTMHSEYDPYEGVNG